MDDNGTLLAERLKQLFKPSRSLTGFLALGAAGFFALGVWAFYEGILWNSRLVSWKKIPGTIVEKKVDKKGNCRYEYEFLLQNDKIEHFLMPVSQLSHFDAQTKTF